MLFLDSSPLNYARYQLSWKYNRPISNININATLWYSKMASFRKNKGILVQICNIHILVTIQVTRLKFGIFPYLSSTNLRAKFYGFLETQVLDPYYLSLSDVEFPFGWLSVYLYTRFEVIGLNFANLSLSTYDRGNLDPISPACCNSPNILKQV